MQRSVSSCQLVMYGSDLLSRWKWEARASLDSRITRGTKTGGWDEAAESLLWEMSCKKLL